MTLTLRDWASGSSPLHRMDARWKLLALMSVAVSVVWSENWAMAALACGGSLCWLRYVGVTWGWLVSRLGGVGGFLIALALVLPLTVPGQPDQGWTWGPIWISYRGVELAVLITLRTLTVACVALLLLTTTPLEQLTRGLLGLGIPRIVVQLLSMSVRYVYVLGTELKRLRIALRTRGYRQSVTRYSYQTTACVIGSLVVRSQERAERIAQAMYCRGFSGEWRLLPVATQHTRDAAMALVMVLSLVLLPWIIAVSYQRL